MQKYAYAQTNLLELLSGKHTRQSFDEHGVMHCVAVVTTKQ